VKNLILKSFLKVQISNVKKLKLKNDDNFTTFKTPKSINFICPESKENFNKKEEILVEIQSENDYLTWNSKSYKGQFWIVSIPNSPYCHLINLVELDDYLSTVISKEMSGSWPLNALKAQAVLARTYALYHMKKNDNSKLFDLENSIFYQVSGTVNDETIQTIKAVQETKNEVLVGPSGLDQVFFHGQCAGRIYKPEEIWKNKVKGFNRVQCPYCSEDKIMKWTYFLNHLQLKKYLKINKENDNILTFINSENEYMKENIVFDNQKIKINKSKLRKFMGESKIKSHNFIIVKDDINNLKVIGSGNGHGVGLCQVGAKIMAQKGHNYSSILKHYFPSHKISNQLQNIYLPR
jgi:stage II sporulation protein D